MDIQEIKGKERIQGYPDRRHTQQQEGFQESLLQNLRHRSLGKEAAPETEVRTRRTEEPAGVGILAKPAGIRVNEAAGRDAVQTAEVRHMTYEESDHIEIAVTKGYTLKGKLEGRQVYVEAKYEDGRLEAYQVDTGRLRQGTEHKIERFAMETLESAVG